MTKRLFIAEYERPQDGPAYAVQAASEGDGVIDQTAVDFTVAEAKSAAFGATTRFVRLHTDAICSIKFGKAPTATTDNKRMVIGQTEYFFVQPGDKVSVISNT